MKYYPVFLDIRNRHCLVVGGGSVGTRKAEMLLRCGARVTVVSRAFTAELKALEETGQVKLCEKDYEPSDLDSVFMVFAATDSRDLNGRVRQDSEKKGILMNIADDPDASSFVLPAVHEQGDLIIAVSTSGNSPAFARKIKNDLAAEFGPEYAEFLKIMGAVRKKLLAGNHDPVSHKALFEKLIESGLLNLMKNGDTRSADHLLKEILGTEYGMENLIKPEGYERI